jgi:hypothetical protein
MRPLEERKEEVLRIIDTIRVNIVKVTDDADPRIDGIIFDLTIALDKVQMWEEKYPPENEER